MAEPKTLNKRNLLGSKGPALAGIPADAAITIVIGNSGGKSLPLPPPEQNQTTQIISEQVSARMPRRALTTQTLPISNERVPLQHTKYLGTTKTDKGLGPSLSIFAPTHRVGSSLVAPTRVVLHTQLTLTTEVKLFSQCAIGGINDLLPVDLPVLSTASDCSRASRTGSASILRALVSAASSDDAYNTERLLGRADTSELLGEFLSLERAWNQGWGAGASMMCPSMYEDTQAAIQDDGRLKNTYPEDDEYRAMGWDERAWTVAWSRANTRGDHRRDALPMSQSADAHRAMYDEMVRQGVALRQDDTARPQRKVLRYRKHQERHDDTRMNGRDVQAQHAMARERATVGLANPVCQQRELLHYNECCSPPEESRINCREYRGILGQAEAREGAAKRWDVLHQRHEVSRYNEAQLSAEDSRMNGWEPHRETLGYQQRQQRHGVVFVAESEALALHDDVEEPEECCRLTSIIARLEAEKQRVIEEAARAAENRIQLQHKKDEDVPRRIAKDSVR
ncbi:hypothetical protein C8J57DRAFT_1223536 [Mycena rebaudengoi]|nr:hypothetical protein C8J57DRAFT_1223536 [Mycena rebaudengoi]